MFYRSDVFIYDCIWISISICPMDRDRDVSAERENPCINVFDSVLNSKSLCWLFHLFHFMIKRSIKWYRPHKSCGPISAYKLERLHLGPSVVPQWTSENFAGLHSSLRLIENYISYCRTNNNQDYERNNNNNIWQMGVWPWPLCSSLPFENIYKIII